MGSWPITVVPTQRALRGALSTQNPTAEASWEQEGTGQSR